KTGRGQQPRQRSSPVGAEDVVAGGRAGRVEGRRTAVARDDTSMAVAHADAEAGRREALRQHGAGRVHRGRDLEDDGSGGGLPTRVVPPAALGLPGGRLAAKRDRVARLRVALGKEEGYSQASDTVTFGGQTT